MKNLSTGTGLALLAGAIVAFPFVNRISAIDQIAHAAPPVEAAKAISAAVTAQATPTIVWYQAITQDVSGGGNNVYTSRAFWLVRAWSDGKVEGRYVDVGGIGWSWTSHLGGCSFNPSGPGPCVSPWIVIAWPNEGTNAAADINFDSKVDGNDLGQLLAAWGDAPRYDIPPSDCPLNLVNP
jgi:hypothetical protein